MIKEDILENSIFKNTLKLLESTSALNSIKKQAILRAQKFDINKVRVLPAMAKLGTAALVTQQIASRMGKKSGEDSIKPKQGESALDRIKKRKERTETDVKNLNTGNY